MKSLLLPILFVAAACSPAEENAPAPTSEDTPAPPASLDLRGEWRVAGIDGADPELAMVLTVSGGEQILDWQPGCAQLMHRYWIDGTRFSAARIRHFVTDEAVDAARNPLFAPPCLIALPPGLEDAMVVVEMADTIERTPENGIRLSGNGRRITLFSQ